MTNHTDLIKKLKAADAGSRELDELVRRALHPPKPRTNRQHREVDNITVIQFLSQLQ